MRKASSSILLQYWKATKVNSFLLLIKSHQITSLDTLIKDRFIYPLHLKHSSISAPSLNIHLATLSVYYHPINNKQLFLCHISSIFPRICFGVNFIDHQFKHFELSMLRFKQKPEKDAAALKRPCTWNATHPRALEGKTHVS